MLLHLAAALLATSAVHAQEATSSSTKVNVTDYDHSLRAGWVTSSGQGVFTDGLTQLQAPVGGNTSSSSIYGLLLEFNTTLGEAANSTRPGIPFVALVSCDGNGTSNAANSTATNSTSASNSTMSTNSTMNSTSSSNVFSLAEELGAVAFVLYSTANQSCTLLNSTSNATSSVPIFTLPAASHANILLEQFSNIDVSHRYYNATLLVESAGNLSQALATAASGVIPQTGFLLAQIQTNATDNASPVVATVGRAPTSSATSSRTSAVSGTGTVATGQPSQPASGASALSCASALTVLAAVMGAWIQL